MLVSTPRLKIQIAFPPHMLSIPETFASCKSVADNRCLFKGQARTFAHHPSPPPTPAPMGSKSFSEDPTALQSMLLEKRLLTSTGHA